MRAVRLVRVEHGAEQAVCRGQRAEPRDQLLGHPRGQELGEAAVAVRNPDRRIAGVDKAPRDVDEPLQDLLDAEIRRDREHGVAHLA